MGAQAFTRKAGRYLSLAVQRHDNGLRCLMHRLRWWSHAKEMLSAAHIARDRAPATGLGPRSRDAATGMIRLLPPDYDSRTWGAVVLAGKGKRARGAAVDRALKQEDICA